MFRQFRLLILTGLLVTAAVVPSAAQGKAAIGISDNKPDMFADGDFKALGAKYVRVVVGWNVMSAKTTAGKEEKARFILWMAGAKANGQRVLLTFDNSKDKLKAPSPKALVSEFKKIRTAFPGQIKDVAPWNEPNVSNKTPKQSAAWTKAVKKACKTCTIVTDVVDKPNLNAWIKKYLKALGKTKVTWGLHNYVDVNNFQTKRTKAFLKVTKKGDVWLTETGGVVGRNTTSNSAFAGTGIDHQTQATTFLFDKIVKPTKRIKRVYIYNWNNLYAFQFLSWDSALKDEHGVLRPSYNVLMANR
jgi:hypothetical protein